MLKEVQSTRKRTSRTRGRGNKLPSLFTTAFSARDPGPCPTTSSHISVREAMDHEQDWNVFLGDHPVFGLPKSVSGPAGKGVLSLELSVRSLPDFTDKDTAVDGPTPSGRRQVMVIKDSDLIVAAGSEIRITSLADSKSSPQLGGSGSGAKSYKVCMSPCIHVYSNRPTRCLFTRLCIRQTLCSRFTRWHSTRMRNF